MVIWAILLCCGLTIDNKQHRSYKILLSLQARAIRLIRLIRLIGPIGPYKPHKPHKPHKPYKPHKPHKPHKPYLKFLDSRRKTKKKSVPEMKPKMASMR